VWRTHRCVRHAATPDYVVFLLEPSVAQPPLPLQEFLPLQPASLVLHPPLPLQEFCPLQACFSLANWEMVPEDCPASALLEESLWPVELEETVLAFRRVIVPPSRPVNAAVSTKEPLETLMVLYTPSFVGYSRIPQDFRKPAAKTAEAGYAGSLEYTTAGRPVDYEACNKNRARASIRK